MGRLEKPNFQIHKIKQAILRNGESFIFQGVTKNEYLENVKNGRTIELKGIFHETFTNVTINNADDARVKRVPSPAVLVLFEEGMPDTDWVLEYSGSSYRVIGTKDLSNLRVATEICLEEIT